MTYPRAVIARIRAAAEADPEREVCGFVVRRRGELEVLPVRNAAASRAARGEFTMDPAEQLKTLRTLEADGGAVVAIYHSHVGSGAELSRTDRRAALAGGAPLWPGVEQIVVALRHGVAVEARRYRFAGRDFREFSLD